MDSSDARDQNPIMFRQILVLLLVILLGACKSPPGVPDVAGAELPDFQTFPDVISLSPNGEWLLSSYYGSTTPEVFVRSSDGQKKLAYRGLPGTATAVSWLKNNRVLVTCYTGPAEGMTAIVLEVDNGKWWEITSERWSRLLILNDFASKNRIDVRYILAERERDSPILLRFALDSQLETGAFTVSNVRFPLGLKNFLISSEGVLKGATRDENGLRTLFVFNNDSKDSGGQEAWRPSFSLPRNVFPRMYSLGGDALIGVGYLGSRSSNAFKLNSYGFFGPPLFLSEDRDVSDLAFSRDRSRIDGYSVYGDPGFHPISPEYRDLFEKVRDILNSPDFEINQLAEGYKKCLVRTSSNLWFIDTSKQFKSLIVSTAGSIIPRSKTVHIANAVYAEQYVADGTPKEITDVFLCVGGGPFGVRMPPDSTFASRLGGNSIVSYQVYVRGTIGFGFHYYDEGIGQAGSGMVEDISTFIDYVKKEHPVARIHLVGASFGAYLSIKVLEDRKVDSLILINPLVSPSRFFKRMSFKENKNETELEWKRWFGAQRNSSYELDLGAVKCPVLCFISNNDSITPPEEVIDVLRATSTEVVKTVIRLPGGHDLAVSELDEIAASIRKTLGLK
jgi:pimeloyl-ACP methyl ester carboxylesterase